MTDTPEDHGSNTLPDGYGSPSQPQMPPGYAAPQNPASSPPTGNYSPSAAPVQSRYFSSKTTEPLAIISLLGSLVGFLAAIGFIAGIITGHIALHRIKQNGREGRGLALTGLIVGYVGAVGALLIFLLFFSMGLVRF